MAIFGKKDKSDTDWYTNEVLGWQDEQIVIARGKDCALLFANASATKKTPGFTALGKSCKSLLGKYPGLCEKCPCANEQALDDPEQFETKNADGSVYEVHINTVLWADGKPATMLMLRDITEQQKLEQHLYQLAYIDQLTKVPNRRKLTEDLTQLTVDISAGKTSGVLALFDLDNFKAINDTYGHNTGDLMLRRLADNISTQPNFKDTVYRLGGDEFVILLSGDAAEHSSFNNLVAHYKKYLTPLLRSYTIPNVDLSCTISIGLSFFPRHGDSFSELLRKADIALYVAKENGRNRIDVFEDRFDQAKRFKDLYINIQPILTSGGKTYGYELVDRGTNEDTSSDTVNLTEFNRTLDALDMKDIDNSTRYCINYTDQLLSAVVLNALSPNKFIVQISVPDQLTRADVERIVRLREHKYGIALTGITGKNATAELLKNAEFCRFDKSDRNYMMQKRIINANPAVHFIASDINTADDFQRAKAAGYHLFQGYFFSEPVVTKKTKDLTPIAANYFKLIQLTSSDGHVDFREISDIISGDVSLSYKLLKLLNSAAVGLRNISSISMAVAYLGEENLKKWIGLLALRGIADNKPIELVRLSLVRARFGELLAPHLKNRRIVKHIFLLGMLSLLHIAMEMTMEELLEDIPVAEEIRDSLLTSSGPYSYILQFYNHYEYANWDEVTRFADEQEITSQLISDSYISAVKWYNDLTKTNTE